MCVYEGGFSKEEQLRWIEVRKVTDVCTVCYKKEACGRERKYVHKRQQPGWWTDVPGLVREGKVLHLLICNAAVTKYNNFILLRLLL